MPRMPRIQALTARKRAAPALSSASDALAGGRLKARGPPSQARGDVLPLPELYDALPESLTDGVNFCAAMPISGCSPGRSVNRRHGGRSFGWVGILARDSTCRRSAQLAARTLWGRRIGDGAASRGWWRGTVGGACWARAAGMASTALPWDSQHHWLEIPAPDGWRRARTSVPHLRKVPYVWRAPWVGPPPSRPQTSHAAGGLYDASVDSSATAEDIRNAYRVLAKEAHPDVGGTQSRFQALQKAYAVLSDDTARKRFDEVGPERDDDSTPAPHKSRPDSYCPTVCVVAAERAYARRLRRRARTR